VLSKCSQSALKVLSKCFQSALKVLCCRRRLTTCSIATSPGAPFSSGKTTSPACLRCASHNPHAGCLSKQCQQCPHAGYLSKQCQQCQCLSKQCQLASVVLACGACLWSTTPHAPSGCSRVNIAKLHKLLLSLNTTYLLGMVSPDP